MGWAIESKAFYHPQMSTRIKKSEVRNCSQSKLEAVMVVQVQSRMNIQRRSKHGSLYHRHLSQPTYKPNDPFKVKKTFLKGPELRSSLVKVDIGLFNLCDLSSRWHSNGPGEIQRKQFTLVHHFIYLTPVSTRTSIAYHESTSLCITIRSLHIYEIVYRHIKTSIAPIVSAYTVAV